MATGVTQLFYTFLDQLKRQRRKVSFLQLVGRQEAYLVGEFVAHVFHASKGRRVALTNIGSSGEQKFDIAFFRAGDRPPSTLTRALWPEDLVIDAFIEAKYLRNRHRLWSTSANDETLTALRDLHGQLKGHRSNEHGGTPVVLRGVRKDVYGLVFASYVRDCSVDPPEKKRQFYDHCLQKAKQVGFRYHDKKTPNLTTPFQDQKVSALGRVYEATLKVGLWRAV